MASETNEDVAVLPTMMSVDGLWSAGAETSHGALDDVRKRAEIRGFTYRQRAVAVLNFVSRVALVGGVLTALEFAI